MSLHFRELKTGKLYKRITLQNSNYIGDMYLYIEKKRWLFTRFLEEKDIFLYLHSNHFKKNHCITILVKDQILDLYIVEQAIFFEQVGN